MGSWCERLCHLLTSSLCCPKCTHDNVHPQSLFQMMEHAKCHTCGLTWLAACACRGRGGVQGRQHLLTCHALTCEHGVWSACLNTNTFGPKAVRRSLKHSDTAAGANNSAVGEFAAVAPRVASCACLRPGAGAGCTQGCLVRALHTP